VLFYSEKTVKYNLFFVENVIRMYVCCTQLAVSPLFGGQER